MVLQIPADRQILENRDAGPEQFFGWPDAGHQEQVRGTDNAG